MVDLKSPFLLFIVVVYLGISVAVTTGMGFVGGTYSGKDVQVYTSLPPYKWCQKTPKKQRNKQTSKQIKKNVKIFDQIKNQIKNIFIKREDRLLTIWI